MKRIILAITGASGVVYGITLLELMAERDDVEVHLVISPAGERTIGLETDWKIADLQALADTLYQWDDISAAVASGSFPVSGMLIAPCSIKTLSGVANSFADNLITRAADVQLKEGRPIVLMVRETPLHRGHLQLMDRAAAIGATIMPPMPAFYSRPETIADLVRDTARSALRLLGLDAADDFQWQGG